MPAEGEEEEEGQDDPQAIWRIVLPPAYAAARMRHAAARSAAYALTRDEAIEDQICGPDLRIEDIDSIALSVWQQSWRSSTHPSGAGNWYWPALVERLPRRAAVLPIAIWYRDDLCGLALGQASRRRANGSRHTVTVTYAERRPEPPPVPLHGHIIALVAGVARNYALSIGARRVRLRNPDRNLLRYYQLLGFQIAWKGKIPVYCEKEV